MALACRLVRGTDIKKWCCVWRFICKECRKTFTRLPPFLLPGKQYTAKEIEGVMRHLSGGGTLSTAPSAAEESTLRRWWKEYSGRMQEWASELESDLRTLDKPAPNIIRLSSDPLTRLERTLSYFPALSSQWAVLVRTLYWIFKFHPLCLSSPSEHGIDWCQYLRKGDDTS